MRTIIRLAVVAGLMLLAAAISPLQAQSRGTNPRMARLHIMWPSIGSPWTMDVSVDGKKVGTLRTNTYVHVDRPPGKHKLTMHGVGGWTYDADINVGPGAHYYEIGPSGAFNYPRGFGAINRMANGVTGKQVKGSASSPGLVFLEVARDRGPAALAKLRPVGKP